jgi:hypothetical protein
MAMVYLSARTLKTHQAWRSTYQAWQKALDEVQRENARIQGGVEEGAEIVEPGIDQLQAELHRVVVGRGTVWFNVKVEKIDPQTGIGALTIEYPQPHDIVSKMIVFAFERAPVAEGGKYLGEFKITKGDGKDKTIEIAPNLPLTDQDRQRLSQAKGPWTLYAVMPVDDAKFYAAMTPDERRILLPGKSPERLAEFAKADRPLRDYEYFFHQNSVERELLAATIATTQDNLRRMASAQKKADEDVQFRQGEIVALTADREKFLAEQKAIRAYLETLQKKLVNVRADWQNSLTATIQTARKIQRIQLKAAEEIDRATGERANLDAPAPAAN